MTGAEPAFDAYAEGYDDSFTNTPVGRLLRNRVWHFLGKHIQSASHPLLLEINCGTGEDALWLSKKGFAVTATDLSEGMIATAKKKAEARHISIRFQSSSFETLHEKYPEASFDIIFSDFGGLNCVDEKTLMQLSVNFHRLLKPGGKLVAVVMSRDCWWERRYFQRKGKTAEANRRKNREGITAVIGGKSFTTWYYSPEEFAACFARHFSVHAKAPVGWLLPPSYLDNYFRRRKFFLALLNLSEKWFGRSVHAAKADHFFIVLDRKN